mgnify:FL=1
MIAPTEPAIIDLQQKGDTLKIIHGQDMTPILNDNYELRKHTKQIWRSKKKNSVGEFVGRLPILVLEDWIDKGFIHPNGCNCGCTATTRRKMLFAMLNLNPEYKVTKKTL